MPSPSWKRTKPFSAIPVPGVLGGRGNDVSDRGLVVHHEQLRQQRIVLAELGESRRRPSSRRCSAGLPLSFAFSIAIARSRSTSAAIELVGVERQRVGGGDVHRDLLAERLSGSQPELRSRERPARRSCRGPGRPRCGRRERPRPGSLRATAARRSDWFSPIVAMLLVSVSVTVPPRRDSRSSRKRIDVRAGLERESARRCGRIPGTARSWRRNRSPN